MQLKHSILLCMAHLFIFLPRILIVKRVQWKNYVLSIHFICIDKINNKVQYSYNTCAYYYDLFF